MQKIVKLAVNLSKLREEQEKARPYHINLLEQLRCNENSHTRILIELLKYNKNGEYPFLDSFITLMLSINKIKDNLAITKPSIFCGKEYLDGYVEDNDYAIIIENKVCDAIDQESQIDRYFEKISQKINPSKIYIIYLTSDGIKKVSESSYSNETRDVVGNHFIEMNYKEHIIPWLNALEVDGENEIKNCVELYINYLEGWFDMNKNDGKEYEEAKNEIFTGLDVYRKSDGKKLAALLSVHENLDDFKETIEQSCNEYAEMLLTELTAEFEKIAQLLKLKLVDIPETGKELLCKYSGFGFSKPEWKKCTIRFEFDDNNLKELFFGIQQNTEDTNTKKLRTALEDYISFNEEEGDSDWWPWWKMTEEYRNWDEAILHEIMTNSSNFINYAIKKLKEMLKLLKDENLEQYM